MLIPDVNILVAAFNANDPRSDDAHAWLTGQLRIPGALGVREGPLSSMIRVVTNPRVAIEADGAFEFASVSRDHPGVVHIVPTPSHRASSSLSAARLAQRVRSYRVRISRHSRSTGTQSW